MLFFLLLIIHTTYMYDLRLLFLKFKVYQKIKRNSQHHFSFFYKLYIIIVIKMANNEIKIPDPIIVNEINKLPFILAYFLVYSVISRLYNS